MRRQSDTYIKIYNQYREDRSKEVLELKREVRELKQMVEFLCKTVFKD
jgi:hypothetical protein